MRTTLAKFALAALFTSIGLAQSPDRTFPFTQPASPADMRAMTTLIRTVVDLQDVSIDEAHQALTVRGPVDKMLATDWLFHQLDQPAEQNQAGPVPQYRMAGEQNEVISVFRLPPSATNADLTALVTAIRTVADLQRMFPYESQKAIVGRGAAEKIAAADWMVRQLWPPDGKVPTADSPAYPSPVYTRDVDPVIRIFRMDPGASDANLTAMVTAIRTVADVQRLFPYETGKAVIASGSTEKVAVAAWLIHEMRKGSSPQAAPETTLPGEADGRVRLFFVDQKSSHAALTALVTEIRSKTGIARIFTFYEPAALVLRGPAGQMPVVEELLAEYAAGMH